MYSNGVVQHGWPCPVLCFNVLAGTAAPRFTLLLLLLLLLLHVLLQHLVQRALRVDADQHNRDYRGDRPHDDYDELHAGVSSVVVRLLVVIARQEARRRGADEDVGDGAGDEAEAAEGVVAEVDRGDTPAKTRKIIRAEV